MTTPKIHPSLRTVLASATVLAAATVAGCANSPGSFDGIKFPKVEMQSLSSTTQHGYVVSPEALQQAPVGSSKDQVLIALGSPSTTANYGNEVFYYISQTRSRGAAFLPERVINQRVVAVYFDSKNKVGRIADYGLQDGRVFDFVSRTTPTAGIDQTFLQQLFTPGQFKPQI